MTVGIKRKPINDVLADTLAYYKGKMTVGKLSAESGVTQSTIGYYLKTKQRSTGKSGKPASAKITELSMIAEALGIEVWQLLKPLEEGSNKIAQPDAEKKAYALARRIVLLDDKQQATIDEVMKPMEDVTKSRRDAEKSYTSSKPKKRAPAK